MSTSERVAINPDTRRAALIATAVTVPFVVIAAFAIHAVTGGNSTPSASATGVITAAAPPQATAQQVNCTKVLEQLPVALGNLGGRVVHTMPDSPFVVAWGAPAIVLACGVDRPKDLVPGSGVEFRVVNGLAFDLDLTTTSAVYTTVDRAAYISIDFPAGQQPATYLPPLVTAITKALPAVCSTNSATPNPDTLCTRRK